MKIIGSIGWIISYALLYGLIGPFFGTCTQGSDDPWIIGLIIAVPLTAISLPMIACGVSAGRKMLWLTVSHVFSLLIAAYVLPFYFLKTTIKGIDVCSAREGLPYNVPTTLWQRLWAPTYVFLILSLCLLFWRQWRRTGNAEINAESPTRRRHTVG